MSKSAIKGNSAPAEVLQREVPAGAHDVRLDVFLTNCVEGLSRSRVQALVKSGRVTVNNSPVKASHRLKSGNLITLRIPPPVPDTLQPETVPFEIVYEDEAIIVLDKPPGVVVHPSPGHATGTLVQGLLKHCTNLSGIGGVKRPGIVHRLDKDTSGLLVAAKNDQAHAFLAGQFKGGEVRKCYAALVHGCLRNDSGEILHSIGRHPTKRKKMAVVHQGGRRALTLWRKSAVFRSGFSLLDVFIKTGRTHQIRVHLAYINHPVAGDTVYGFGRNWWKKHMRIRQGSDFIRVNRQMLHAKSLGFNHPVKKEYVEFQAPLPEDMQLICRELQEAENGRQNQIKPLTMAEERL